jgi:hypothetical protein
MRPPMPMAAAGALLVVVMLVICEPRFGSQFYSAESFFQSAMYLANFGSRS